MRMLIFIFLSALLSFSFGYASPAIAQSMSGACSWHGGIDYAASPDWDGSVVCSDGWRDSSVLYIYPFVPACTYPYSSGCSTESDLGSLRVWLARSGGLSSSSGQSALGQCAAEIEEFNQKLAKYELCMHKLTNPEAYEIKTPVQDGTTSCREQFGQFSYEPPDKVGYCRCVDGYQWDISGKSCVVKAVCVNGSVNAANACECGLGLILSGNVCIEPYEYCKRDHGVNTVGTLENGKVSCSCAEGYKFAGTLCEKEEVSSIESPLTVPEAKTQGEIDLSLVKKLMGHILLQVQDAGKAWYVNDDGSRYYMKDGAAAYGMMRNFGLGISDKDLESIPFVANAIEMKESSAVCAVNPLAMRVRGRILLQVERNGEAWYVHPDKCRRIYLRNGEAAYEIMRYLSLGISNTDIGLIPIAVVEN